MSGFTEIDNTFIKLTINARVRNIYCDPKFSFFAPGRALGKMTMEILEYLKIQNRYMLHKSSCRQYAQ